MTLFVAVPTGDLAKVLLWGAFASLSARGIYRVDSGGRGSGILLFLPVLLRLLLLLLPSLLGSLRTLLRTRWFRILGA